MKKVPGGTPLKHHRITLYKYLQSGQIHKKHPIQRQTLSSSEHCYECRNAYIYTLHETSPSHLHPVKADVSETGVDEVLAAVGQQGSIRTGAIIPGTLSGVDVQAVLAVLREGDANEDLVPFHLMLNELLQSSVLGVVAVEGGDEFHQRLGHAEAELELAAGVDDRLLVRERDQAEHAIGLRRAPFPAGTFRKGDHDHRQTIADDPQLAHRLELHRLAGEILASGDGVGKDVEEEVIPTGGVDAEDDRVPPLSLIHI